MTKEQIYLIVGAVFFILSFILSVMALCSGGKTHPGATTPSKLPPPPPKEFVGPWYLIIRSSIDTPATYIKADIIEHLSYDYDGNVWIIFNTGEKKHYADVYEFEMIPIKHVGDFCWQIKEEASKEE